MEFLEQDPNKAWKFKNIVNSKVSIVELMKKYNLQLEEKQTGQDFTHRTFCPFHKGKNGGRERTPSMFVSEKTNSFFCFGCLEENDLVWSAEGLKKIAELKLGEMVFTHLGTFGKITQLHKKIDNKVMLFNTGSIFNDPLKFTEDHLFIVIDKQTALSFPFIGVDGSKELGIRLKPKKKIELHNVLHEKLAKSVRVGDFVTFPIISSDKRSSSTIDCSGYIKEYVKGPKSARIDKMVVCGDVAWFLGLWLAEGSVGRGFIRFSCSLDEKDTLLKRACEVSEKYFGAKGTIFEYPDKNTSELIISRTDLANIFKSMFGSRAQHKNIPSFMLSWPEEIQKSLIRGYFDGDGCGNKAKSVSKKLAYGMYAVCIQSGMLPSISHYKERVDANGVNHREYWELCIRKSESYKSFICVIDGTKYYVSVVREINRICGTHTVVDISVNETNSFTTRGFSVHNCGVSGTPIHFVSLMDGTPPLIALQKLAKDIGLIKKNGQWDELQLDALSEMEYSFDPSKTIEPYIFDTSTVIRNHIKSFVDKEEFEKELKWIEKVGRQLDIYLNQIGHEDWEDAIKLRDKLSKKIKSRAKIGEK